MARFVTVFNAADDTQISTLPDFAVTTPGTPSAEHEIRIWNDKGGVNVAAEEKNLRLRILAKETADAQFAFTNDACVKGYMEYKIVAGLNHTVTDTGWIKATPGGPLIIPALASNRGVIVLLRANPPSYIGPASVQVKLVISDDLSYQFSNYKAGIRGFKLPVGIHDKYEIFYAGDIVLENPGGADDNVLVPSLKWVENGIPYHLFADLVNVGTVDSAAATPGPGESFIALLTLGGGQVNITLGENAASPDPPDAPEGEILIASAEVDDSGNIAQADIQNFMVVNGFGFSDSGFTLTIEGGICLAGERVVEINGNSIATLEASEDNYVSIAPDSTVQVDSVLEEVNNMSELLCYMETDGAGAIASQDLRKDATISNEIIQFRIDAPSLSDVAYNHYLSNRRGYVKKVSISVFPDSGTTSGATEVDIEYLNEALAWVSIFASDLPKVDYDAAYPLSDTSFVEVPIVRGRTNFRCTVTELPGGGTIDSILVTMIVEIL